LSTFQTRFGVDIEGTGSEGTFYARQRYVTSSGEVYWVFILREKLTKKILAMYQAPDHPCFGNGGKPLLVPHPFGNYDLTQHDVLEMREGCIVQAEDDPDQDLLQVIKEEYDIDDISAEPNWPTKKVTVGLPPEADFIGAVKEPIPVPLIKKSIPKPKEVRSALLVKKQ